MNPTDTEGPSPPVQWFCGHWCHINRSICTSEIGSATIRSTPCQNQNQNPETAAHKLLADLILGETHRLAGDVRCSPMMSHPNLCVEKCHGDGINSVVKEWGGGRCQQNTWWERPGGRKSTTGWWKSRLQGWREKETPCREAVTLQVTVQIGPDWERMNFIREVTGSRWRLLRKRGGPYDSKTWGKLFLWALHFKKLRYNSHTITIHRFQVYSSVLLVYSQGRATITTV